MPLRRLPDDESWKPKKPRCLHPEHNPPSHIVLKPGHYEHTCPHCKQVTHFTVPEGPSLCVPLH